MRWWHQTCRTWPSGVMFNRLASSSYIKERDTYLIVPHSIRLRALFLTFETAYMAHGGSMWSLRGPQSQDDKPESRHSSWRLKRDETQPKWPEPSSTALKATLTISWHHTHRLPANVLIFLWQTWHLPEQLSVRVQSWAATWEAGERKDGDENIFSDLHRFRLTQILVTALFSF